MRTSFSIAAATVAACFLLLADGDVFRQAGEAREANHIDEAIHLYQKALSENPKWTEGWWYLGTLFYDRDEYTGAAPAFVKAAALDPKAGTTWAMLGLCEMKLAKNAEALQHLQEARTLGVAKDQQLLQVVTYSLARLWLERGNEQGDFEKAQDYLDVLVREGVESDDLTFALGCAVLRTRPSTANAEIVRAAGRAEFLAAQRAKRTEAKKAYQELIAAYPKVPNAQFAYGKFLLAAKEDEQAIVAFQREMENTPDHLLARIGIAGIKARTDPAGGLPYAAEAVTLAPAFPEAHYLLGLLSLDTGDVKGAIKQLETARKLAPNEAKIYFALGRAYAHADQPALAAEARTAFTRLNQQPEAQPAH